MNKLLFALAFAAALLVARADAAGPGNPFLYNPGTSNNGLYVAELELMSTELDSLATGSVIISSVGGSSGAFNNSNTGQGLWAVLQFIEGNGGTQPTCTAGANLAIWFLQTLASTYEITTVVPPRPPDAIIPLYVGALTAGQAFNSPLVQVPALPFKVMVQNNCGANFPAFGTTAPSIYMGIFTVIY
jgi:hypothetical protein